jgi:glutathione S-transferase
MITLYTFGPMFDLPDPSPFVMKGEMLLKLAGLEYRTDHRGFTRAPKGKLPYIEENGTIVADSTLIRLYLEKKHHIDFDRGLSVRDRGVAWAVEKMLEEQLYWAMVHWRWLDDANFEKGPKGFFRRAPAFVRPIVERMVRRRVRQTLYAHGIGRHSDADMHAMAERGFTAVAQVLGNNRYFMGDEPCGADATVFAFVTCGLAPWFDSPLQKKLQSMQTLVAYRDRLMSQFFPEFAKK